MNDTAFDDAPKLHFQSQIDWLGDPMILHFGGDKMVLCPYSCIISFIILLIFLCLGKFDFN